MTLLNSILWLLVPIAIYFSIALLIVPCINKVTKYTPIYNGEKPTSSFETWNGIGTILLGPGFRKDSLNDSEVKYAFLSILIPLIPIGCYRVTEISTDSFGGGYIQENTTKYKIYGSERWRIHEVILIYVSIACGLAFFILFVNLMIILYDMIHKS